MKLLRRIALVGAPLAPLIGSRGWARRHGLTELAVIRDYQLTGVDSLHEEMLLGPAMSIPRLLGRNGLGFGDIDAWEIHEAFATQVLINRQCMASAALIKMAVVPVEAIDDAILWPMVPVLPIPIITVLPGQA